MARIAIIGGHGKVALRLAKQLTKRDDSVTAFIRNPFQKEQVERTGASVVVGDITDLEVPRFAELLKGHDAIVWSAGAGGGDVARTYSIDRDAAIRSFAAAEQAGVARYIHVSYFGAGDKHGISPEDAFFAYADAKTAADEALTRTHLDWTILRPSTLTLDHGTGKIDVRWGDGTPADATSVTRDDVATVIAELLPKGKHRAIDEFAPENAIETSTIHRIIQFNNGSTPIREALASGEDHK